MRKNKLIWLTGKIAFWILVIFIFFYMLFPFYWAVNSSLKSEAQLQMTPATFIPVDSDGRFAPTLQNYVAVFNDGTFVRALWNSTIVAGLTTLCFGESVPLQPMRWVNFVSKARSSLFI